MPLIQSDRVMVVLLLKQFYFASGGKQVSSTLHFFL